MCNNSFTTHCALPLLPTIASCRRRFTSGSGERQVWIVLHGTDSSILLFLEEKALSYPSDIAVLSCSHCLLLWIIGELMAKSFGFPNQPSTYQYHCNTKAHSLQLPFWCGIPKGTKSSETLSRGRLENWENVQKIEHFCALAPVPESDAVFHALKATWPDTHGQYKRHFAAFFPEDHCFYLPFYWIKEMDATVQFTKQESRDILKRKVPNTHWRMLHTAHLAATAFSRHHGRTTMLGLKRGAGFKHQVQILNSLPLKHDGDFG